MMWTPDLELSEKIAAKKQGAVDGCNCMKCLYARKEALAIAG